jgi:hypothetical protein
VEKISNLVVFPSSPSSSSSRSSITGIHFTDTALRTYPFTISPVLPSRTRESPSIFLALYLFTSTESRQKQASRESFQTSLQSALKTLFGRSPNESFQRFLEKYFKRYFASVFPVSQSLESTVV